MFFESEFFGYLIILCFLVPLCQRKFVMSFYSYPLSKADGGSGKPKLLVTVSSNNQVPADMQKRISPIVKTEIDEFSKKDVAKVTVGQPATFTFGLGKSNAIGPGRKISGMYQI